jgi:hypothetical protein
MISVSGIPWPDCPSRPSDPTQAGTERSLNHERIALRPKKWSQEKQGSPSITNFDKKNMRKVAAEQVLDRTMRSLSHENLEKHACCFSRICERNKKINI